MSNNQPSQFALRILRWFCPTHLYEEIEGDLMQKFERDVNVFGEGKAKRRLMWNVIRFFRPGILLRNKFSVELNQTAMFQNYFKTTYRHLLKNKINFGFKLGGLTLALFSFLVIAIYVSYQLSFDKFHEDYENIYRANSIRFEDGKQVKYAAVPLALGASLKAEFPEVKSFAGISEWGHSLVKYNNKLLRLQGFVEADSTLFDVFTFRVTRGNKNALNNPHAIILTESACKQIFGTEDPLNKLISFPDRFDRILEVAAVIEDLPSNSSLNVNAIISFGALREKEEMPSSWEMGGYNLFLKMDSRANIENFPEKIKPLLVKNLVKSPDGREKHFSVFLQSLSDMYLGDSLKWEFDRKGNPFYLYIYSCLAFFLLVIASINYLNLSIADFNFRNKEIGVRKILGARKKQIAIQITIETFLYCLLAFGLSLLMLIYLFPHILQLIDSNLRLNMLFDSKIIAVISLMLIFLILFSTAYPAYKLSMNNPIHDLKRGHGLGGKLSINKLLLIAQFSISIFCLCATWAFSNQLIYIQTRDIGFDRHNLYELIMPDRYPLEKAPVLKNEIAKIPGVQSASFSYYHITGVPYFNDWYHVESNGTMRPVMLNEVFVDHDFIQTLDVKLLTGRTFDRNNKSELKTAYIVNETAVKEFGWTDPIGMKMSYGQDRESEWEGTVIGVVKDFNTLSLHRKIEPLVMRLQYDSWPGYCLNIRIDHNTKETLAAIEAAFKRVLPDYLVDIQMLKDRYELQYQNENRAYVTLQASTWIILLVSSLGIFSLSIYMSIKRMKEFGIRKVLGASVQQIASLHINHFLKLALLANIISLPIAYYMLTEWLSSFAYRVELNFPLFLLVALISFLLVILSAGYLAWKAGRMNPVDVIKMD